MTPKPAAVDDDTPALKSATSAASPFASFAEAAASFAEAKNSTAEAKSSTAEAKNSTAGESPSILSSPLDPGTPGASPKAKRMNSLGSDEPNSPRKNSNA